MHSSNRLKMQSVTEMKEIQEFKKRNRPILLSFYTSWCAPCRIGDQIIEKGLISDKRKITMAKIQCDFADDLVLHYHIDVVPTYILLDSELKMLVKVIGIKKQNLQSFIAKVKEIANN